jgi:hypothetical protein
MQVKLSRYRWLLLLLVAIAGLATWLFWPNAMREKYDRIRLGMTRAEVASVMGWPPSGADAIQRYHSLDLVAAEERDPMSTSFDATAAWSDESVVIGICYSKGEVVQKSMLIGVPPWKSKLRERLDWLRGLVGQ